MSRHDQILTGVYHRGQDLIWDGRAVLEKLLEKHGGPAELDPHIRASVNRIFTMILQGEEAAWKISLQLASMLDDIPARMAATSQAHDEARHFYVMRDYLAMTKVETTPLPASVTQALAMVMGTDSLAKKLLGMQLMVEPVALTIFHAIRKSNIDPMLSELLFYFERDEARHVALGVHHLPQLIREMTTMGVVSLTAWQLKMFMLELQGLKDLRGDFVTLGLDVNAMFDLAERKQIEVLEEVAVQLGWGAGVWKPLRHLIRYQRRRILG